MKKKIIGIITVLLMMVAVTGCDVGTTKTLKCTKSEDNTNTVVEVSYTPKTVKKVVMTSTTDVEEAYIDASVTLAQTMTKAYDEIDGITMTVSKKDSNKLELKVVINYDDLKVEQIKELTNNDSNGLFYKKNVSIETLKKEVLSDYNCD